MMKRIVTVLYLLIAALCINVNNGECALDPPHDATGGMNVNCSTCHYPRGSVPMDWSLQPAVGPHPNDAAMNLCQSCHHVGNNSMPDTKYADVKTHSSADGKYGTWMVACSTCHSTHTQDQRRAYVSEADINTGVITAMTDTQITIGNLLQSGAYAKSLIIPNTLYSAFVYRIKDNTTDTILSTGKLRTAYAGPGTTYSMQYGKFVDYQIVTPLGTKPVKFFNFEGPNSFAASSSVVDGICQVCHTQTGSFKSDGTLEGPGHPVDTAGKNCMQCHPHSNGFQAIMP